MLATVVKRISFDAAHKLPNHKGKCASLHGHHWVVEVGIKGEVDTDGMVIDFSTLKGVLEEMFGRFDHSYLNDTIPNPTAENLVQYIWGRLYCALQQRMLPDLEFVRVWETEDSYAEVRSNA